MPSSYVVQLAKTGRATCKVCKEKISKGALRVGTETERDDVVMTSWRHAGCFKLPKTFKNDIEGFIEEFSEKIPTELRDDFRREMNSEVVKRQEKKKASSAKFEKLAAAAAGLQADAKSSASEQKGAKKRKKSHAVSTSSASAVAQEHGVNQAELEAYCKYSTMTVGDLKQILKFNFQVRSGKKDELLERCMDGHQFGAIPRCPDCKGGEDDPSRENTGRKSTTLRRAKAGWVCQGFHNGKGRISCNFSAETIDRAPWITTAEEFDAMQSMEEAEQKIKDSAGLENADFDATGMNKSEIVRALSEKAHYLDIALPKDKSEANVAIGQEFMANDQDVTRTLISLRKQFGTNKGNEEKSLQAAEACVRSENADLARYFDMAADAYTEFFKKTSAAKVSLAMQKCDFVVGKDGKTGKAISTSKKHKIPGIGKSSGQKIDEFLETGKIEAFDNLLAEAGVSFHGAGEDKKSEAPPVAEQQGAGAGYGQGGYSGYGAEEYGNNAYGY